MTEIIDGYYKESMTENEAVCTIMEYRPIVGFKRYAEALNMAIQALEEIQQYRAIGTIDEFKALKEHLQIIQEAYENTDGYKDGYAKAIDEFAERLKAAFQGEHWTQFCTIRNTIDKIAEQMEGGAE